MDVLSPNSVTLPNGEIVTVSASQEEWWTLNGGTGYLHPSLIAPDPAQPRKAMNPNKLAELHGSIATVGVRESITVTPRSLAPWASVEAKHEGAFFLIVSGHRRWNGASLAELKAVPVKVNIYASAKEHYLDGSLLNAGREDLSPIEEGWELVRLREQGWKIDALAKMFGMSLPQLYGRMNLTKLHPNIQKLLDPELPPKQRLSTTVGGMLGGVAAPTMEQLEKLCEEHQAAAKQVGALPEELDDDERRFHLQQVLLCVIQMRGLNSTRAIEFIRDRTLKLKGGGTHAGAKTERYQPQRRKDILENLLKEVNGTVIMDWPPTEFRRIFEYASYEDIDAIMKKLQAASEFLGGLSGILLKLRDEKKPTRPEVLALIARNKKK